MKGDEGLTCILHPLNPDKHRGFQGKDEGYLRNPIMNSSSFACGSSMGDSKAPFRACGTNKLKLRHHE